MQRITPFLWFDDQAEEAVNFYVSVFKNSKVEGMTHYTGEEPSGPKGSVMTVAAHPMQISKYRSTTVAIFVSLALAGCDRNQSQTPQQSTINQTPDGRSQTKALRAASAVGYDGKQLQKRVDNVLEQKEKRERDLEKELNDTGPQ